MAQAREIKPKLRLDYSVPMELTEVEVRALQALACYGSDAFLKVFYEKLGKHYMHPHEAGIRSLFSKIGREVPSHLRFIDAVRNQIDKTINQPVPISCSDQCTSIATNGKPEPVAWPSHWKSFVSSLKQKLKTVLRLPK